ncbi:MAG TPA: DnaB-like helicase C-terminal domain-containing protein [Gemmatimonadales bacterium]|nr:DnaB-like helicase C-terminal domain-containing protein [Gemmatimonadales bacterium]
MQRPRPSHNKEPSTTVEALVQRMDARSDGTVATDTVPTGFPSLDRMLAGGFRRQDLIVLAGDVGSGKSSLGLAMAIRGAQSGVPTVFLSGEMTEDRLMERALALEARVPVDALRSGALDDVSRASVGAAALRLRDLPLQVRSLSGQRFTEVSEALDTVPRRALLVIDSLQMTAPPTSANGPDEAVAGAARALKALALDHDVAVLVLAQLPGLKPSRRDPRPSLEDLGGLGVVKQVADVVLAIYREEMYRPAGGVEGATELIVAKNRNGTTGFVDLYFYHEWLRFEDMVEPGR